MRRTQAATCAVLLTVALMAGCLGGDGDKTPEELHVGYMICNSLPETKARFEPLSAYLSDLLGVSIVPHYFNTFETEREVRKGQVQVVHSNSLVYVILKENQGWNVLAGEREGSHGTSTAGVVFVAGDSPIQSLDEIRGKRLMFGPEMAPMGFMAQYYLLLENGIDPELDLAYYAFTRGAFTHEKVVYSVLYGGYDAGAVPLLDLENMEEQGKVRRDDYRILATSEFFPYCTFSTSPDLPEDLRRRLKDALLSLTRDTTARVRGEVLRVLDRAGVDGYELLDDAAYEPVRRMARRVNMPPYQEF